jgi:hypothetical protein
VVNGIAELNTERPTLFGSPRNLSNHMDKRDRAGDTVLITSREMTGTREYEPNTAAAVRGRRGEDDRKPNTKWPRWMGNEYASHNLDLEFYSRHYRPMTAKESRNKNCDAALGTIFRTSNLLLQKTAET